MTRNVLLLAGITLQALTMKVQLNVAVQKISFNTAKQMGMTFVWSSCAHHNLRHQEYCQSKGYLYCSQDRPPRDHNSGCNTRDHCHSCFRSHSHIVMIAEFAIASQLLVIVRKKLSYWTPRLFKITIKITIQVLFVWPAKPNAQSWSLYPSRSLGKEMVTLACCFFLLETGTHTVPSSSPKPNPLWF